MILQEQRTFAKIMKQTAQIFNRIVAIMPNSFISNLIHNNWMLLNVPWYLKYIVNFWLYPFKTLFMTLRRMILAYLHFIIKVTLQIVYYFNLFFL